MPHNITITVNGREHNAAVDDRELLVSYLREALDLTGAHVGCVVGECGACSVLLDGDVVKSCLMLAVQADGHEVRTIEGLADDPSTSSGRADLHPIQQAFVDEYGLQCGYCTPGMVMSASALLARNPDPTEEEIREALAGNLCMCTGYVQIVRAVMVAAGRMRQAEAST